MNYKKNLNGADFSFLALIFIVIYAIIFSFVSVLVYVVCWAFDIEFSFKMAVGIFASIMLLGSIFGRR